MKDESRHIEWPPGPGDRDKVPAELAPPANLEDRIVENLKSRGLLTSPDTGFAQPSGWQTAQRASLATAACAALLAVGLLIGRQTAEPPRSLTASLLTGAESDLYALLLYETDGYDAAGATEAAARYGEYSQWVGKAVSAGQFVTGEDLEVDRGWLLTPSDGDAAISNSTAIASDAPLSGIFFIRADSPDQALQLASSLPHLKHGGQVLVQKTIPTDTPPQ